MRDKEQELEQEEARVNEQIEQSFYDFNKAQELEEYKKYMNSEDLEDLAKEDYKFYSKIGLDKLLLSALNSKKQESEQEESGQEQVSVNNEELDELVFGYRDPFCVLDELIYNYKDDSLTDE